MELDTAHLLTLCGLQAPSADNSQPLDYLWDGSGLSAEYAHQRVGGLTFPESHPATLMTAGGALENITQLCRSQQQDITIEELPKGATAYFRLSHLPATFSLSDPLDHPIFKRHTNRHPFLNQGLDEAVMTSLENASLGNARSVLIHQKDKISHIKSLIQRASVIRFKTKEVHEWLGRSLRFSKNPEEKRDGLDLDTLALPAGGRLLMQVIKDWRRMRWLNHFGAAQLLAGIDAQPIGKAPLIIAFIANSEKKSALDCGRLLTRQWIQLNQLGLSVQPYYVISDLLQRLQEGSVSDVMTAEAKAIEAEVQQLLDLKPSQQLLMLLRVGYSDRTPVRSQRLPLDTVFIDTRR